MGNRPSRASQIEGARLRRVTGTRSSTQFTRPEPDTRTAHETGGLRLSADSRRLHHDVVARAL
jgi:hypothetical protein